MRSWPTPRRPRPAVATHEPPAARIRRHRPQALENGVTHEELIELVTHLAFYAWWPTARGSAIRSFVSIPTGARPRSCSRLSRILRGRSSPRRSRTPARPTGSLATANLLHRKTVMPGDPGLHVPARLGDICIVCRLDR